MSVSKTNTAVTNNETTSKEVILKRTCNTQLFITTLVLSILSAATMTAGGYLMMYAGVNSLSTFIPGLCLAIGGLAFEISTLVHTYKSCQSKVVTKESSQPEVPNSPKNKPTTSNLNHLKGFSGESDTELDTDTEEETQPKPSNTAATNNTSSILTDISGEGPLSPEEILTSLSKLKSEEGKNFLQPLEQESFNAFITYIESKDITDQIIEAIAGCPQSLSRCSLTHLPFIVELLKKIDPASCQDAEIKGFIQKLLTEVSTKKQKEFVACYLRYPKLMAAYVSDPKSTELFNNWKQYVSQMEDQQHVDFLESLSGDAIKIESVLFILTKPALTENNETRPLYHYLTTHPIIFAKGLNQLQLSLNSTIIGIFDLMGQSAKNLFLDHLQKKKEFIQFYLTEHKQGSIPPSSIKAFAKHQSILAEIYTPSLFSLDLIDSLLTEMGENCRDFLEKVKTTGKLLDFKVEEKTVVGKFKSITKTNTKVSVVLGELLERHAEKLNKLSVEEQPDQLKADSLFQDILVTHPNRTAIEFLLRRNYKPEFCINILFVLMQTEIKKPNTITTIIKNLDQDLFKQFAEILKAYLPSDNNTIPSYVVALIKQFCCDKDKVKQLTSDTAGNWKNFLEIGQKK